MGLNTSTKRELLDKKELIEYLNGKLSFDTLGRLTREGRIPVVRFPGVRRFFYDRQAIDRWLDALQLDSADDESSIIDLKKCRKAN